MSKQTNFEGPIPTTISIATGPFVGPVLRRVVGMLAARADLPFDKLDDAILVADLIAARAPNHMESETLAVTVNPGDRALTMLVGPLRKGGGQALVGESAVPGVGNVIEQLTDAIEVTPQGTDEFLQLELCASVDSTTA